MNILQVIPYILQSLSNGRILRRIFSILLRILGVVAAFGILLLIIQLLKAAFGGSAFVSFVGIVLSAIMAAGGVGVLQIFFYRADTIKAMNDSKFTVIPIVAIIIRVLGEALAFFYITLLVMTLVTLIFSMMDSGARYLLEGAMRLGSDHMEWHIAVMILLMPVIIITVTYYIAEALSVAVDIADNVRTIASGTAPATVASVSAAPISEHCPECGAATTPDDAFCMNCGHKLKP